MADMAMGACMWSGVPTHTASRLRFSLASIWRQSWYTRASGNFALSCFSWAESTSATQTSFTLGWRSSWSRVTNAMPPAPKAPSRNWPLGGAEINWRTKNGAAKKVRRSIRYDICGTGLLACRNRPVLLHSFRDYERLAVVARHHGGRFLIARHHHGLRIEIDGPSQAIGDVGQVHQHGGRGAFLDLRRQGLLLAIAHRCRGRGGEEKVSSGHRFRYAIRALLYHIPGISARKARNAELWGGPPGPRPTPPSACRSLDEADFVGEERDQGSRADEGVR